MSSINTYQPIDCTKAIIQPLTQENWHTNGVSVDILRLDLIHPVLSGNKWYKLKYHLQKARDEHRQGILTFGGAYSNHLVAAAIAARQEGLAAIGIVRGEALASLSPTLQEARDYGMQLQFVTRAEYQQEETLMARFRQTYPGYLVIPAGGQGNLGVRGAMEITALSNQAAYTHIACAIGTGTMLAGIVKSLLPHQQAIGISSLKIPDPADNSLLTFLHSQTASTAFTIRYDYHFGGYARKNNTLLAFMNEFHRQHGVPTDFVYTGKLMYAIDDLIQNRYFPVNSRILAIHSGGLQGNRSLPAGTLKF